MKPLLNDLELVTIFIETLKSPYYKFFIGNFSNSFIDLITMVEWVKKGLKKEKITKELANAAQPKKIGSSSKKKKTKVHVVSQHFNGGMGASSSNLNYLVPPLFRKDIAYKYLNLSPFNLT